MGSRPELKVSVCLKDEVNYRLIVSRSMMKLASFASTRISQSSTMDPSVSLTVVTGTRSTAKMHYSSLGQ